MSLLFTFSKALLNQFRCRFTLFLNLLKGNGVNTNSFGVDGLQLLNFHCADMCVCLNVFGQDTEAKRSTAGNTTANFSTVNHRK